MVHYSAQRGDVVALAQMPLLELVENRWEGGDTNREDTAMETLAIWTNCTSYPRHPLTWLRAVREGVVRNTE